MDWNKLSEHKPPQGVPLVVADTSSGLVGVITYAVARWNGRRWTYLAKPKARIKPDVWFKITSFN